MTILHHPQLFRQATSAFTAIKEAGQIENLKEWLASARSEYREALLDRKWRRNNAVSAPNVLADLFAELTDTDRELSREGIWAEYEPDWTQIAYAEIVRFAKHIEQQSRQRRQQNRQPSVGYGVSIHAVNGLLQEVR